MNTAFGAHVIMGLGYGDEGKGTMTDFLCRHHGAKLVVRYSGGSQAGHNVVTSEGAHHTFSQIGSGAFVPGVCTLLSKFMLWEPIALAHEVAELSPKLGEHALNRHFIDGAAPIITPFHVAANRFKEWVRGGAKHGSCGKGVGEAASDLIFFPEQVILGRNLAQSSTVKRLLVQIQERKRAEILGLGINLDSVPDSLLGMAGLLLVPTHPERIADSYKSMASEFNIISESQIQTLVQRSSIVFEGAQGVLLDEWHGFHPYTTWSTTVPTNALELLRQWRFSGDVEIVGVVRSHMTRHGAGPFVTEGALARSDFPTEHNVLNEWQGTFRFGGIDGVMLRYAADCVAHSVPITSMAITHLDVFNRGLRIPWCDSYRIPGSAGSGSERVVSRLIPHFTHDLDRQAKFTELLQSAKPAYVSCFEHGRPLVEFVESLLQVPVRYLSSGPTAQHKYVR